MTAFLRLLSSPLFPRTSVPLILFLPRRKVSGGLPERHAAVDALRVALLGDPAAGGAFLDLDMTGPAEGLVLFLERRVAVRTGAGFALVLMKVAGRRRGRDAAGPLVLVVLFGLVGGVGRDGVS